MPFDNQTSPVSAVWGGSFVVGGHSKELSSNSQLYSGDDRAILLPLAFQTPVWSEYSPVLVEANRESQLIPTFSTLFRLFLGHGVSWKQFQPAATGCLWAGQYFWRNRRDWDWKEHGLLVLLVSMLVAPYSWFTDEIIVLPAILARILSPGNLTRSLVFFGVLDGIALLATVARDAR